MNLLYLAMITERVPVIPYFTPTHVGGGNAPTLAFGEVFDIPRLQKAIGSRILEWHEVKDPESEIIDTMGCWSVWKGVQSFNTESHFTSAPDRLKLGPYPHICGRECRLLPHFRCIVHDRPALDQDGSGK